MWARLNVGSAAPTGPKNLDWFWIRFRREMRNAQKPREYQLLSNEPKFCLDVGLAFVISTGHGGEDDVLAGLKIVGS